MPPLDSSHITPLAPHLGGEVRGVDVNDIARTMSRDAFLRVVSQHGLLVFRDQQLTPAQFAGFSHFCGELEYHVLDQYRMPAHPEVYVISNIVENGVPLGNPRDGFGWHTDQSYVARPTAYTLLYGQETPAEGADTLFANTALAFEQLPGEQRAALRDKTGVHSYVYMRTGNATYIQDNAVSTPLTDRQRDQVPDVRHPLVRTNPITGRHSLYLGGDCLLTIEGMQPQAARRLIDQLFAHALRTEFQLAHKWRRGDLVIWDNRGVMHTATDYDRQRYRRHIWRTSVKGEVPY